MATVLTFDITPTEARTIAKDAYIYGFPLVDNYRIQVPRISRTAATRSSRHRGTRFTTMSASTRLTTRRYRHPTRTRRIPISEPTCGQSRW